MIRRPSIIIMDDLVDPPDTPEYRAKVLRWYNELKGIKMKAYELPKTAAAVNALAADISLWAEAKGFWKVPEFMSDLEDDVEQHRAAWDTYHRLKKAEKIALMHSELSELLEGLRSPTPNEAEELADLIIRALDYAGHYSLRIGEAIAAKMAKNENRPYMHGKSF